MRGREKCPKKTGPDKDGHLGKIGVMPGGPPAVAALLATHAGCGPDGHLSFAMASSSMPALLLAKDLRHLKHTREEDMHVMVLIFVRSFCISTAMVDKVIN